MVANELMHFRRYVADLPEGAAMVDQLELLARRVERDLSPRLRKEMILSEALMRESRVDWRGSAKATWASRIRRGE
jgi:hypothetical protein